MSDAVTTSADGKSVILTCQNPGCGAVSSSIRITPVAAGDYWCGVCGEWGFNFDIVGLTEIPAAEILSGPLGPDGVQGGKVPVNISPRWLLP